MKEKIDEITKKVEDMYKKYPYPSPSTDPSQTNELLNLLKIFELESSINLEGKNILDAGTGSGHRITNVAEFYKKSNFLGIDVSEKSLQIAKQLIKQKKITNLKLKNINLMNEFSKIGKFDIILCMGVLHHLSNPEIGLKNIGSKVLNQEHMNIQPRTVEILKRIPPGGNFTAIDKNDPYYVKGMISHVYRRLHPDEPSKTIIASGGGGTWGYHYPEPRALTNRERARLQGFPDDFVFEGKFGEIRKQIGNAVPPAGIFQFVNSITDYFNGDYDSFDLNKIDKYVSGISIKDLMRKSNSNLDFNASDLMDDNLFTS